MATEVYSFGFKYGDLRVEATALVIDVRTKFKNPFHNKALRYLRGDDARVAADVRRTPDFERKLALLLKQARAHDGPVYIGCTAGHHRSVFIAAEIAKRLGVEVLHLHYDDR